MESEIRLPSELKPEEEAGSELKLNQNRARINKTRTSPERDQNSYRIKVDNQNRKSESGSEL